MGHTVMAGTGMGHKAQQEGSQGAQHKKEPRSQCSECVPTWRITCLGLWLCFV